MEKFLKKAGWTNVLSSVIFILIGILLVAGSDIATKVIAWVLGIIIIINGIAKIIEYFVAKGTSDFYNYDLVYGIVAIIIGVVTIFASNTIEFIIRVVLGIWIIYSGLLRTSFSIKLHKLSSNIWIFSLVISILMIILGAYILVTSGAVISTIGVLTIISSVMDLIESFIFMKKVDEIL